MHTKSLFLTMLLLSGTCSAQAGMFDALKRRFTKSSEPEMPSWKQDITEHTLLWTCSPLLSTGVCMLLGKFNNEFKFIPQGHEVKAIVIPILAILCVDILLSLLLARWSSLGVDKENKHLSFQKRLWRFVRFVTFTGLIAPCLMILEKMGSLRYFLPAHADKSLLGFVLIMAVYPCLISLGIARVVIYIDSLFLKRDKQ